MTSFRARLLALTCLAPFLPTPALAQAADPATSAPAEPVADGSASEVVVFDRGEAKIGIAQAASEGTVAGSDLLVRPLLRVAELLEAIPGMIAAQHSGSGKANMYFLRGFNLEHGSDFTTYIDGVPMSLRTHGHGQGYLDLNGLIPEIVEREDYRKGPYRADGGDFALAGTAYMTTIERIDAPMGVGGSRVLRLATACRRRDDRERRRRRPDGSRTGQDLRWSLAGTRAAPALIPAFSSTLRQPTSAA